MSESTLELQHVDIGVTGMTCTSCSSRVERKLNKLDGVTATVNFATETASVDFNPAAVSAEDLMATIQKTGYGAFFTNTNAPEAGAPEPSSSKVSPEL